MRSRGAKHGEDKRGGVYGFVSRRKGRNWGQDVEEKKRGDCEGGEKRESQKSYALVIFGRRTKNGSKVAVPVLKVFVRAFVCGGN